MTPLIFWASVAEGVVTVAVLVVMGAALGLVIARTVRFILRRTE